MIALLLFQAAVAGPVLEKPRRPTNDMRCGKPGPDGEIVVCAKSQEEFRLRPVPERYVVDTPALPKAETSILGGKAKIAGEVEQGDVGGFPTNRAMVRLKVPF